MVSLWKMTLPGRFSHAYNEAMDMYRKAKLAQELERILDILIREYQPERVILFGSMASGQVNEWSDLDLVVIKETQCPFMGRLKEVALLCRARVGVDYLVYRPAEFQAMIAEGNPFVLKDILQRGKVLYERQPAASVAR